MIPRQLFLFRVLLVRKEVMDLKEPQELVVQEVPQEVLEPLVLLADQDQMVQSEMRDRQEKQDNPVKMDYKGTEVPEVLRDSEDNLEREEN